MLSYNDLMEIKGFFDDCISGDFESVLENSEYFQHNGYTIDLDSLNYYESCDCVSGDLIITDEDYRTVVQSFNYDIISGNITLD